MVTVKDFIREISRATSFTQSDITTVMEAAESILIDKIKNGEEVKMFRSVRFIPELRKAHTARIPQTGQVIDVPEMTVPRAKFSKSFREFVKFK